MSLAVCTSLSTLMTSFHRVLPLSCCSIRTRTIIASTINWRYSGWGMRFKTISTWRANFISPGVIWERKITSVIHSNYRSFPCHKHPVCKGRFTLKVFALPFVKMQMLTVNTITSSHRTHSWLLRKANANIRCEQGLNQNFFSLEREYLPLV